MIDWNLGNIPRGLAVEGDKDKIIIEAFLDAGERNWSNWRSQVKIMPAGSKTKVIDELQPDKSEIWGLIDKDSSSQKEIDELQAKHQNLLILPRWTIENYFIDPSDLVSLLPQNLSLANITKTIDESKAEWLKRGALWHVFEERGLFGEHYPNPRGLFKTPMPNKDEIRHQLEAWNRQLNPDSVLSDYDEKLQEFYNNPDKNYRLHIHGKKFFQEVIVQALNYGEKAPQDTITWIKQLLKRLTDCPADIVPILRRVVG
ncbi:MAG: hypothetical protein SFZ02_15410 [bacterium]|nr:hypothetical protein [bacterium]